MLTTQSYVFCLSQSFLHGTRLQKKIDSQKLHIKHIKRATTFDYESITEIATILLPFQQGLSGDLDVSDDSHDTVEEGIVLASV